MARLSRLSSTSGSTSRMRPDAVSRTRGRALPGVAVLTMIAGMLVALVGWGALSAAGASSRPGARGPEQSSPTPKSGGSLTVLEWTGFAGSWPGLDPATDTNGAADQSYMDAIYGELFELGTNGQTIDDLATGYHFTNSGKTIVIDIRKGVVFSDGTPFDADAVVYNWDRDVAGSCSCKPTFSQSTPPVIKPLSKYSLSITLDYVDASFINALQDDIFNWVASPTAIRTMSAQDFALKPVGAGPFTVVSDTPSSVLVLKKNPKYWQPGLPYLDSLTFKAVADDDAAYEAMLAGSGGAYEDMSTPALAKSFAAHFVLTNEPSTSPYDIQLNTAVAPFNNIEARKAIYYATDAQLLDEKLFGGQTPVGESFEAPAGLFYEQTVPGYIGYDLAKAQAIVKSLGGLTIDLFTIQNSEALDMVEALQTEWEAAGMSVTINEYDLSALIAKFLTKTWQAALQTAGAYDPGTGVGVAFRFASTSPHAKARS